MFKKEELNYMLQIFSMMKHTVHEAEQFELSKSIVSKITTEFKKEIEPIPEKKAEEEKK